jgi:transcription initiation factor TFIIIB Brf1 subunit/transcription initiation factor TFIIB
MKYSELVSKCDHKPILDEIKGDYICSKCGLVLDRLFISSKYQMNENEEFSSNENSRYVALGERMNMVDGLGSYIGFQNSSNFNDKYGRPLKGKKQILFKRLKYRYDLRARINDKETDYRILNILNRIVNMLNLTNNVRDQAAYYYRKITKNTEKDDITNHVILIATCIFLAVREFNKNAPVTIQEIADTFQKLNYRVSARTILREIVNVKPIVGDLFTHQTRKSEDYINRIISSVINSNTVIDRLKKRDIDIQKYQMYLKNKSKKLLNHIKLENRGGRNPFIFSVAVIYSADQIYRKKLGKRAILTQKILADITECAEYSIRDHYRFIKNEFLDFGS